MSRDLTTGQVARLCGVAPRTASKWVDDGGLNGYRIPGPKPHRRVPRKELIRFLVANGCPVPAELDTDTHKILTVGMDPTNDAHKLRGLLPEDCRIEVAASVFDAGVMAADMHPDTFVVDLAIGRSAAIYLAADLRANPAYQNATLIALAGEDEAGPEALQEYGYDEVFIRPFDVAMLAAVIARRSVAA